VNLELFDREEKKNEVVWNKVSIVNLWKFVSNMKIMKEFQYCLKDLKYKFINLSLFLKTMDNQLKI